MKLESSIGWCDATANIVIGCSKVSAGCARCYAESGTAARVLRAQGVETWGPKGVRKKVAGFAAKVRQLNRMCVCDKCHESHPVIDLITTVNGEPRKCFECADTVDTGNDTIVSNEGPLRRVRLFADSNSDWLDEAWPVETLVEFLDAIRTAPNVDFLLLTKRIEKFEERMQVVASGVMPNLMFADWLFRWMLNGDAPKNVWFGASVESQQVVDERVPQLLKVPAAVRFLSVEPLLEEVRLEVLWLNKSGMTDDRGVAGIDWIIVGGESGPNRRDCGVDAIEDVAGQCLAAGVPCYVKQASASKPGQQGGISDKIWNLKQFPETKLAVPKL